MMFSLLYTFCLPFYLINIHVFDYPDSRLSGLFTEVPTSPDNRGSTVLKDFDFADRKNFVMMGKWLLERVGRMWEGFTVPSKQHLSNSLKLIHHTCAKAYLYKGTMKGSAEIVSTFLLSMRKVSLWLISAFSRQFSKVLHACATC